MTTRSISSRIALALALVVAPGALLSADVLAAVTMKGKIVNVQALLNPVWNEAKDPKANRFNFREPSATVRADVRILRAHLHKEVCVVALADEGKKVDQPLRVVVSGGRASPVTLVVAQGQEIQLENHDPWPHQVYEVSGKGGLGEGTMAAQGTRKWTPPGPGKYEIRDKISPSVRSWVVVEPKAAAIAYPTRKGDFAIDLEPGSYKLRAYHNGEPVGDELPIEVKPAPAEQPLAVPLKAGPDVAPPKTDAPKQGG
jgi:hypothetical protein